MEPLNPPLNPTNGTIHNEGNQSWIYIAGKWQVNTAAEIISGDGTGAEQGDDPAPDALPADEGEIKVFSKSKGYDRFDRLSSQTAELSLDEATNEIRKATGNTYSTYVALLKNLGYISTRKPTRTTAVNAWRQMLRDASARGIAYQDVLATGIVDTEVGTGESTTKQYNNMLRSVQRSAVLQGVKLTKQQIDNIASQATSQGWDSTTINENVVRTGKVTGVAGTISDDVEYLKQLASQYGVSHTEQWYTQAATEIASGLQSRQSYEMEIKNDAKELYPAQAANIDAGIAPKQKSDIYAKRYQDMTGLEADLNNPWVKRALSYQKDDGSFVQMPVYEFEQKVRKEDPNWKKGPEAQEKVSSMIRTVSQFFGRGF